MAKPVATSSSGESDPKKLHHATDQLNGALGQYEKWLQGQNLGVTAQVTLEVAHSEDGDEWRTELAFDKVSGGFRRCTLSSPPDDEGWTVTLLVNASRETRLKAVPLLPKLHEALIRVYDTEVDRVNEATAEVTRLLAIVGAGGSVSK